MAINMLPLHQKISHKSVIKNFLGLVIFFLLLSLPTYRILSLKKSNDHLSWLLALLCELWFTFYWALTLNIRWTPLHYQTYPDRLTKRVDCGDVELPCVDMFVTTADPELEPPLMTVNTVLSLLAVDYPPQKLACYVSDDGCSPKILRSLVKASEYAKLWIPFCKKYNIQVRAPFRYFSLTNGDHGNSDFLQEWKNMKDKYENFSRTIEEMSTAEDELSGDCEVFANVERGNHPTIIKIISENKGEELPRLIYVSREKRREHPHHFKAGAMNVLTRVSGLITNAPYILNMDCDMFVNNPKVVLHAMCVMIDPTDIAFAQFPQTFYDGPKDDPLGNQMVVLFQCAGRGIAGIQGAMYSGTGCFFRRKVIYGLSPNHIQQTANIVNGKPANNLELVRRFGESKEFIGAASNVLTGNYKASIYGESIEKCIEAANEVASCSYEYGTTWGTEVGWMYGSVTEDIHTSLVTHKKGWRSALCWPEPPAFLGCAPRDGPGSMTQQKRWITGLLEILVSSHNPIVFALSAKLGLRQCMGYVWLLTWGFRAIPELLYALLIARSLIANSKLFPKPDEPIFYVLIVFFALFNLYTISDYVAAKQSMRSWWNNQAMGRVITFGPWLLGLLSVALKLLGISETVFEVTKKEKPSEAGDVNDVDKANDVSLTFDESPVFVPATTVLLIQMAALAVAASGVKRAGDVAGHGSGVLEVFCSAWLVLCLWRVLKGLDCTGKHGIPFSTVSKAIGIASLYVMLCKAIV